MLQSTFFDPVLGLDIHMVLLPTPAGPVPTPVPMPFVGMVFDPVGLALGAAIGMATGGGPGLVLVNGLPVANCGTAVTNLLTLPHLPLPGVGFVKGLPNNDAELMFGSLNVSLGGNLGVRLGDIALSCSDPVRLPTSLTLAIPKGPLVINGAPMVPDLAGIAENLAMLAGMKALVGLARGGVKLFRCLRQAQKRSKGWARVSGALKKAIDKVAPGRIKDRLKRAACFVTGHPVDVATGRVFTDNVDFELPGPLPLVFERVYSSSLSWRNGPMGYGWSHSLGQEVWLERGKVVLREADGREVEFATDTFPDRIMQANQSLYDATNRITLRSHGGFRWTVEDADGTVREFALLAGGPPHRASLQRIRSRDGHHTLDLAYSARGLLEWVRDSCGRLVGFTHDAKGRLTEVKLPLSRETGFYRHLKYTYDSHGDLVEVEDAAGAAWRFEYQGHLMVQETDRAGLSFYFQYDGWGAQARCVRTWGDGGIYHHLISYDRHNRKTLVEDSLGATTIYQLDALCMVVEVMDAHGAATSYAYDPECGLLTQETDALQHKRTTVYDARGNAVAFEGPDGTRVCLEYDDKNLPVRAIDVLGNTWAWAYDREGHLIERQTPTGECTRWGWQRGLLVWAEAPGGRRTVLEYDKQKKPVRIVAPNGMATEYDFDGQGRVVREKDARGAIVRFRYDVQGNLLRVESPTGVVEQRVYDAQANLLEVRDATRHVRFTYGHFHKLIAREEGGTSLRFHHDPEGRLRSVLNEADETYTYTLDALGRVQEETGFDGQTRRYTRDALGQITRAFLPSGRSTEYTYDKAGRPLTQKHADGTGVEFEYREDGVLLRARNESTTVLFERDASGRVVREVQGDHAVASHFDTAGQRILLETSLGGRMSVLHDALGEVSSLHFGEESLHASKPTLRFERDAVGLEAARVLPGDVRVEWQRDAAGRPTTRRTLRHVAGAPIQQLDSRTYHWRGEDQLSSVEDALRGRTDYTHDARGRLIAQVGPSGIQHRAMDAVGNLYRTSTRTDRRYGRGGLLREADGCRYSHDADGNRTEKVDGDGCRWRYHWNDAGLLAEVLRPDGRTVRFEYDAFARRTRKVLLQIAPDGTTTVEADTRFVWDGNTMMHEVSPEASATWYWQPGTSTPVAKETAGRRWAIASDILGTPTEMYDEAGQLAWRLQLDTFGVGQPDVALQHCPWRWPGQYKDEETGLFYNRFRQYDAVAGSYISQDPLRIHGGVRMYAYPLSPLTTFDPFGLFPWKWNPDNGMGHHLVPRGKAASANLDLLSTKRDTPTYFPTPYQPADHEALHQAQRPYIGKIQGPWAGTQDELIVASRRGLEDLPNMRGDLRIPSTGEVIARDVSPTQAFDSLIQWHQNKLSQQTPSCS
ncbi:DUF6531 domain-containing protein [Corallococcus llansteffanensis]|uniref:Type IV secretion protein Rhs n=1 Tax=Corallococcus llansteffanensis TaxID=2316731 RepID=A0A3A8PSI5_9BACT|nr:DUF6531 domain-containing protein [Corallococcus llansteffanensis]RKH56655.1 hypothetical protein D7V93_19795 [Corallococcus llansteffanensis]